MIWANMKAFPVRDIKGYNHAMGKLFIFYGVTFGVLGIPLLSAQNTAYVEWKYTLCVYHFHTSYSET